MQRHEMIEALAQLGLKGMAAAFDDAVTTGLQRNRTVMEMLADLLQAEAAHRQAASIRYRMTAAKLPVMKDLSTFVFEGSATNEGLARSLHDGSFLANRHSATAERRSATRQRWTLGHVLNRSQLCAARARAFRGRGERFRPTATHLMAL